jgi:hypothetical protein
MMEGIVHLGRGEKKHPGRAIRKLTTENTEKSPVRAGGESRRRRSVDARTGEG